MSDRTCDVSNPLLWCCATQERLVPLFTTAIRESRTWTFDDRAREAAFFECTYAHTSACRNLGSQEQLQTTPCCASHSNVTSEDEVCYHLVFRAPRWIDSLSLPCNRLLSFCFSFLYRRLTLDEENVESTRVPTIRHPPHQILKKIVKILQIQRRISRIDLRVQQSAEPNVLSDPSSPRPPSTSSNGATSLPGAKSSGLMLSISFFMTLLFVVLFFFVTFLHLTGSPWSFCDNSFALLTSVTHQTTFVPLTITWLTRSMRTSVISPTMTVSARVGAAPRTQLRSRSRSFSFLLFRSLHFLHLFKEVSK